MRHRERPQPEAPIARTGNAGETTSEQAPEERRASLPLQRLHVRELGHADRPEDDRSRGLGGEDDVEAAPVRAMSALDPGPSVNTGYPRSSTLQKSAATTSADSPTPSAHTLQRQCVAGPRTLAPGLLVAQRRIAVGAAHA